MKTRNKESTKFYHYLFRAFVIKKVLFDSSDKSIIRYTI
jgi:hypothetical protein